MDGLRPDRSLWRSWPLLVVGILIGSLALTPVVSAAGKAITKKKAIKLFEEEKDAAGQYALLAGNDVRVASAGSETGFAAPFAPGGTTGTVVSTQITAPGPGFLVVSGSSQMTASTEDGTGCAIRIDGSQVASSVRNVNVDNTDPEVCATDAAQPVAAGVHTVELLGLVVGGSGVAGTHAPGSINVLFVALGATGAVGA